MTRHCLTLWVFLACAGCMENQKPTPLARTASLYERLGKEPGITRVVDDFVAAVAADDKVRDKHKKHFKEGDVAGLKRKLIDQIGAATGGPHKYTGKNMKEAHRGLGITNADFDALVGDLVKAMDRNHVGPTEQGELKALLGPMRSDVVEVRK
jgi:hemoglobin